ncbi:MAG: nicotinate-nucleotide adenylyltransferase, partial [Defluviitaleaceae bacterium]|nr:nicotinate-nucleotide adenylyltransferase [Defluviitaleaceae bacterium]
SFNPIHYGHLTAAEDARCKLNLDFVLFIPTGIPPHKGKITYMEHRYLMTMLATHDNPYFYVSRMELDRSTSQNGPTYTVDTLRILKDMTDAELFFILGADEMLQISTWKDSDQLPSLSNWVAVTRPGYDMKGHCQGEVLEIPGLAISGTELRDRVTKNEPIKYLVHPGVKRYIKDLNLYQENAVQENATQEEMLNFESLHQAVADKLSEKRYRHTLGVIETAVILAYLHNVNLKKAYLAALLHDYAKEFSEEEKRSLCKEFAITLDTVQNQNIGLMHGQLGSEFAGRIFGIDDTEILEAIRHHTTGRAGMGKLEQIIKIADNTEPNRENYPRLEAIRAMSVSNIEMATIAAIRRDIQYTKEKGHNIHPMGMEALEYLIKQLEAATKER